MWTRKYHGFVGKLHRSLCSFGSDGCDFPDDVKEGHFAVLAVRGGERARFVVEIEWLTRPEFLRLLDRAKEEYGFDQTGAIAVPCRPEELRKILKS